MTRHVYRACPVDPVVDASPIYANDAGAVIGYVRGCHSASIRAGEAHHVVDISGRVFHSADLGAFDVALIRRALGVASDTRFSFIHV